MKMIASSPDDSNCLGTCLRTEVRDSPWSTSSANAVRQTCHHEVSTHTLKFSADAGELTIAHTDNEGKVVNTSFRQVHKSPLVVEAWNITRSGERSAGVAFSKLVQKEVNEIIDRANSWFG